MDQQDRDMVGRWMDAQEAASRALTSRLDGVEAQVGTMAAEIDRFDDISNKLDDLASSLVVIHHAAEVITRGWRFWAKVGAVVGGALMVVDAIARVVLPVLGRLF